MKNIDNYRGCLIGGAAGNALGYPRDPRKRRYYRGGLLKPPLYRQFTSNYSSKLYCNYSDNVLY